MFVEPGGIVYIRKEFMMKNIPKLSIICTAYNHERYIKYALNSIIMQKVNFDYEVLIGEDCSTDTTRDILKDYEKKYPNRFQIIYREYNLGPEKNFQDLYERAKGEYLIVLEADDFWISKDKLQIEYDYLEAHPECLAVAHKCIMIGDNNELLYLKYPECTRDYYTLSDFNNELMPGQTTTIMFRNYYLYDIGINTSLCTKEKYKIGPGDKRKAFMFAAQGKVACLDKYLSAYRYVIKGGSSYTANLNKRNIIDTYNEKKVFVDFAKNEINNEEAINVAEYQMVSYIVKSILKKKWLFGYKEGMKIIKGTSHAYKNIFTCICNMMKTIILKPFGKNVMYKKDSVCKIRKIIDKSDFINVYNMK